MKRLLVFFPYTEPYESLYKDIIIPLAKEFDLQCYRANAIPGAQEIAGKLMEQIRKSDLILLMLSKDNNPNVIFEYGATVAVSMSHGKEFIPLIEDGATLPANYASITGITFNLHYPERLKEELKCWIAETKASSGRITSFPAAIRQRGQLHDDILDVRLKIIEEARDEATQIREHVLSGSLIPTRLLYSSPRGALRYLDLCGDPQYKVFPASFNFIEDICDKIIAAFGDDFVAQAPDYISLGPGNGQKDRILMSSLLSKAQELSANDSPVYYYPYDISLIMLMRAAQTVAKDPELAPRLSMVGIVADFSHLPRLLDEFDYRKSPNLFLLLGNTLGNMANETEFLKQLHTTMCDEDRAVIEVRIASGKIEEGGSKHLRMRFSFTPLELVGVKFEEKKLDFRPETGRSQIRGTKTVMGVYENFTLVDPAKEHKIKLCNLTCIHHYDPTELQRHLEELNFKVRGMFTSSYTAIYVVEKRDKSSLIHLV